MCFNIKPVWYLVTPFSRMLRFFTIDTKTFLTSITGLSIANNLLRVSAWIVRVTLSCFGSRPKTSSKDVILIPVILEIWSHKDLTY